MTKIADMHRHLELAPEAISGPAFWLEERTFAVTFDDRPGLRPEDNDAGARASLEQLARRFE